MVLTELGQQIKEILKRLSNNKQEINKAFVDQILDDISMILLKADVNAKIVLKMRENIKYEFKLHGTELINLQQFILKCIIEQLTEIFQNDIEPYQPKKGKTNVIMFIGLQGSGKTTTCFKYGYYYQKRGWKVGIVCADTLSLDQTKQNAMKLRIPFYGSYTQSDPIQVTYEGIIKFKKERVELILVDTPGKYKEELVLFEEIKQVQNIIQLNNIIFIIDSSIGQLCYDQAVAFKNAISIGSIIITKLDGNVKGGGAITAVVSANSSINFTCDGEYVNDFIECQSPSFIRRLLGLSDMKRLIIKSKGFKSVGPKEIQFTLRDMESQLKNIMKIQSIYQLQSIMPGMNISKKEQIQKIKKYLCIMNSMTSKELDGEDSLNDSRIFRIAKGSGNKIEDVNYLLQVHKAFYKINHLPPIQQFNEQTKTIFQQNILKQIQKDFKTLQFFGGLQKIQNMMKQIVSVEKSKFHQNL